MEKKESRKIYHLINDLPHLYEIEDMIEFCTKYEHIYIYGFGYEMQYMLKYFDILGIHVDGFVDSWKPAPGSFQFTYRELPIYIIEDVMSRNDTGVIVAIPDSFYSDVIPRFRKANFNDYFLVTEYNKRTIAYQMRPRPREELTFEISLADHCNLACQMCDHYSQLSPVWFPDFDNTKRDIKQMGKIFQHEIAAISLLGGEPTLNPDLPRYLELIREEFPKAEIIVLTNGTNLTKWENFNSENIWALCEKLDIHITVTVYPINVNYVKIEELANKYHIALSMSSDIHAHSLTRIVKTSDKHTMDLAGEVPKYEFVKCLYFNKFNVLKDGRLYMCPVEAHIDIFNQAFNQKMEYQNGDYLDIYSVTDWEEIAEFSSSYIPFCRYCDLKKWRHYGPWAISNRSITEYID